MLWRVREGMQGLLAAMRPPGVHADHRGRLRAAGADRRGGQGPPGAARQARLPARPGRPRLGGQPALHPHAELRRAGRPRALRRLHARAGRADRRQVRRLAEGRARHRRQHGAVRGARVGAQGHRADVADQAARRPRRDPRARGRAQPRPARPPAQPQVRAGDRGGARPSASSAASASRCARRATSPPRRASGSCCGARWRASRRARRCSRRCSSSTSTTASRPAPPTGRARPPVRWRSTPASWSRTLRRREHGARAERVALELAKRYARGRAGARAAAAGRRRPPRVARRSAAGGGRRRCCVARARRRPGPALERQRAARRRRAGCPRTVARRRGGGLHPVVHQPDLRQRAGPRRADACPRRWWRSRRAPGCRCGSPTTSPATAAATPWSSKGYRGGQEHMAGADRGRAAALDRRRPPAGRDRRHLVHARRGIASSVLDGIESLDSIAWVHDRLLERLDDQPQVGSVVVHPTCASRPARPRRQAGRDRRAARRRGRRPGRQRLLRDGRRPRLASPRAAGLRAARRRRRARRARFDACVSSNRTCEVALRAGHRARYASFVLLLEELTRREPAGDPAPDVGLCDSCRHQQLVRNTRGSVFSLCRRSRTSPSGFRAIHGCRWRAARDMSAAATSRRLLGRKRVQDDGQDARYRGLMALKLPRRMARFNRADVNPIQGQYAWLLPPWIVVCHRGRRSGTAYRTPVNAYRRGRNSRSSSSTARSRTGCATCSPPQRRSYEPGARMICWLLASSIRDRAAAPSCPPAGPAFGLGDGGGAGPGLRPVRTGTPRLRGAHFEAVALGQPPLISERWHASAAHSTHMSAP